MRAEGVVTSYALFGAVAQMRYTEPMATLDADVLVSVPHPERLDLLAPLYDFCARRGYSTDGEAVRVGAWPVQFIPVFSALTEEALAQAEEADIEGVPVRVVSADHLAAIGLSVGRAKDFARVLALLEAGATTAERVAALAGRHGLEAAWESFRRRFLDA